MSERNGLTDIEQLLKPELPMALLYDEMLVGSAGELSNRLDPVVAISCTGEPSVDDVLKINAKLLRFQAINIVTLGGGSTIDRGKALALGRATGHFHRVGYGDLRMHAEFSHREDHLLAIPTLPGSGAETSRYVILGDENGRKQPSRSWCAVPDVVLIDANLANSASDNQLCRGSFDIFVHAWETLIAVEEFSPVLAPLARDVLSTSMKFVEQCLARRSNIDDVERLMWASAIGGILISNTRVGLMHTLGESLAKYRKVSHPESLALFFNAISATYDQRFVFSRTGLDGRETVANWMRWWEKLGLDRSIMEGVQTSELINMALEDTVLVAKEHPGNLDSTIIGRIIEQSR